MTASKSSITSGLTSILFNLSLCSFIAAMTAYMTWCSITLRIEDVPIAEFGPKERKKFGNSSVHSERYVRG